MSGATVLETFSYAYNADGQLTSAANPDAAYAYAYDGMGRTTSVDNNGTPHVPRVVLSNQYDANSNRTQLAATIAGVADFQNVYTYDALNRLTQLYQQGQTGGNAVAVKGANLTYNLLGQLSTVARTNFFGVGPAPDIATGTFTYDGANRLTKIAYTHNGGTATDAYSWVYDAGDRVTSMTTTADGTANYSYDNTNQVTGAAYTGTGQPANESYTYDANGNRTNTGYSTGTNNQLSSDGTFNYTYDAEGNRSTRTRISNATANDYKTTYTWDYRDRLTDVQFYNNSNVLTKHVHYTYNVFDHLIGKQVDDTGGGTYNRAEFYVYDGSDVALQFNAAGALTERYLQGPSASGVDTVLAGEDVTSLASPGTVSWPLTDNLGTIRDIVDSTGAVIDHLVYNSFGQIASETAPTVHHLQGYTGGIYDRDSGMVNDWHRWYDPTVGRWISEDPIGFAAGDGNLSRDVGNGPTNLVDPFGEQETCPTNSIDTMLKNTSDQQHANMAPRPVKQGNNPQFFLGFNGRGESNSDPSAGIYQIMQAAAKIPGANVSQFTWNGNQQKGSTPSDGVLGKVQGLLKAKKMSKDTVVQITIVGYSFGGCRAINESAAIYDRLKKAGFANVEIHLVLIDAVSCNENDGTYGKPINSISSQTQRVLRSMTNYYQSGGQLHGSPISVQFSGIEHAWNQTDLTGPESSHFNIDNFAANNLPKALFKK